MVDYSQSELDAALRRCEHEPIHRNGQIQRHGVMIVLGPGEGWPILQVSDNLGEFFPATPASTLGQPFASLVGEDQAAALAGTLAAASPNRISAGILYAFRGEDFREMQAMVHRSDGLLVVELEAALGGIHQTRLEELFRPVRDSLGRLATEPGLRRYFTLIAEMVRGLIAFDRVLIYRFDDNWDGEVIAESRTAEMPSYLGNRFPASDIPPQARRLYERNLIRQMTDVEATPAQLYPQRNPVTNRPLDMTHSTLRSFSPVHVEYLRNMGVQASMSVSLMEDGRLWGLIACHHREPHWVPYPVREMAEFIGRIVAMKLAALAAEERLRLGKHLATVTMGILKALRAGRSIGDTLDGMSAELLALTDAAGVALVSDGTRRLIGETPPPELLDRLLQRLAEEAPGESFASGSMVASFGEEFKNAGQLAGVLAIPVGAGTRDCVLWFRSRRLRDVRWAGTPEKIVVKDRDGGLRISPRTSFASWSETWRDRSEDFRPEERETAVTLSHTILDALTKPGMLR